ncbi:MAG: PAS domain S-box protein [Alphaproteobacteria bacterium]|nr:PAS domain S-box protein [Alphaproteobacteria bacterium]MCB9794271.1 PAS domain S-box protein [Alphaproteobacteria bacterium]
MPTPAAGLVEAPRSPHTELRVDLRLTDMLHETGLALGLLRLSDLTVVDGTAELGTLLGEALSLDPLRQNGGAPFQELLERGLGEMELRLPGRVLTRVTLSPTRRAGVATLQLMPVGVPPLLELALSRTRALIAVHDIDARYLMVSASFQDILGYDPDSLIGVNPYDLTHPDDHAGAAEHHLRNINAERVPPIVLRMIHADGSLRKIMVRAPRHLDDRGELKGFVTTSIDVTDEPPVFYASKACRP